jgi:hypothetical protein
MLQHVRTGVNRDSRVLQAHENAMILLEISINDEVIAIA